MTIYDNGFLKLHYEASTDILTVAMPPVNDILLPEIIRSFSLIVEHVRNYDIKKLLVDARETQVDVGEEVLSPLVADFGKGLATTHLQKMARLVSSSFAREFIVQRTFQEGPLAIEFESFTELAPAVEWLRQ